MAQSERRTLEIRAKLKDLLSQPLGGMQGKVVAFAKAAAGSFKNVVGSVFNVKTAVLGLATSFLSLSTIKSFGEQADALLKLATSTGDQVENLSELQAAFELAGIKADGFSTVLRALQNESRKAQLGNLESIAAFRDLGVSIEELRTLGPSQLFEQIAQGLDQFSTAQDKALKLGKLLPKQFLDLLPILGGGLSKFQNAIREARDAGATVTEQQAQVSERLNDSLSKVTISIGGVSRAFIEAFGPDAIALLETLARKITDNREGIVLFAQAIGQGIAKAVGLAIDGIIGLVAAIESIPGVNLLGDDVGDQIATLERQLAGLRSTGLANSLAGFETKPIEDKIAALQAQAGKTLAGEMRKLRVELNAELGAISSSVLGAAPVTGDKAAAAVGLPTPETISLVSEKILEIADKAKRDLAAGAPSVFQPPKSQGVTDPDAEGATTLEQLRAQIDAVQKLAGLAPGVGALEDRLLNLQRNAAVLELQKAAEVGTITMAELEEGVRLVNDQFARTSQLFAGGDFFKGFGKGAEAAVRSWTNFTNAGLEAADMLVHRGLDGIADGLADIITGAQSGKAAFRQFATSILTDLAKIIAKLALIKLIETVGSAVLGKGGVVQGEMGAPVKAFAQGGIASGPTLALFGEGNKREAFVPLPDNRSIPVTFTGAGAPAANVFQFHITAMDGRDVQRVLIEHQTTLRSIWQNQVETRVGMRNIVRRASA
jgi:hypothetical protein